MKLAFSSNAYMHFSIEETIEKIASLGYTGIEVLADVPHAWPAGLLEPRKRSIRDALARHNLAISNVNAFMMNAVADPRQPYWHPSWIEHPHYRAIRREHTKRALQLARTHRESGNEAIALRLLGDVEARRPEAAVETARRHYAAALALATPRMMAPLIAACREGLAALGRRDH